jgi:dTDP-4-dehydrorhamnose reductase
MANVLVTGASGLLGANLIVDALNEHNMIGIYHQHGMEIEGAEILSADLSQIDAARSVMQRCKPDWVVHAAAATSLEACENDPEMAFRLNRDMAGYVAEAAREVGAGLIHISTDAVFDGEKGAYVETDPPNPLSVYAQSKWAGEQVVLEAHPDAAIVRTNFFGWNLQPKQSLAEMFLDHLETGKRCRGFADVTVTTILVNDLVQLIMKMIEVGGSGTYHVGGGECVSKYDFGVRLAGVFGLDGSLIEPISVAEMNFKAKRANNLCMLGDKIEQALGVELPKIDDGLKRFRDLRTNKYADRLKKHSRRAP